MIEESDPIVQLAQRLCETLERIGDALVAVDAETLLETEETLGHLLTALSKSQSVQDKPQLEVLIGRAAQALLRCRRLGASFTAIAGTRVRMRTGVEAYDRDGEYVQPAVSGSTVKVVT
jgi:hypothetical protein